jgi:hypothetical protein
MHPLLMAPILVFTILLAPLGMIVYLLVRTSYGASKAT